MAPLFGAANGLRGALYPKSVTISHNDETWHSLKVVYCNFDDFGKIGYSRPPLDNCIFDKGYDVIISVQDIINKILSCDSNYVVVVVM